jgi:aryl-alcohol dehydrogenase-like predicted oxidoreductase
MTKFMPFPWRLWKSTIKGAIKGSLQRLGLKRVDIYQIHKPLPPVSLDTWMEGMIEIYQAGLCKGIGVCNFNYDQMLRAADCLSREGICLACNQIDYNLLNRNADKSGLIERCRERGIKLLASSPLNLGILSGKYTENNLPTGIRGQTFNKEYLHTIKPLISSMRQIGLNHGNRSPAQVAINWVLCKGLLPVPGAKNLEQAEQNAGAIGWRLTDDEVNQLDITSEKINFQIKKAR